MAYNLLIVDDSAVTRKVVGKAIAMSGLDIGEVHEAQDGQEALEVLSRAWIDIVFTDLNMPRMDGFSLVEKMSGTASLKNVPIVVISSNRNEEKVEFLKALGVHSYVTKPFRPEELRGIVDELMQREKGQFSD